MFRNLIFFTIYLLLNPELVWKAINKKVYIPVYLQFEWLKRYDIKTFIDVGAYRAEVSKTVLEMFPHAQVFAFEPIPENYKYIASSLKNKNFHTYNLALSDKKGKKQFNIYNKSYLSSFRPLSKSSLKEFNLSSESKKVIVETDTLDNFYRKNNSIKGKVFLKIDTQGTEYEVLTKSLRLLKKVDIIHIETSFDEIYDGQKLFKDVYDLLTSHNFVFAGECKDSFFYPDFKLHNSINSVFIKKN